MYTVTKCNDTLLKFCVNTFHKLLSSVEVLNFIMHCKLDI